MLEQLKALLDPNRQQLLCAAIATVLCSIALLAVWTAAPSIDKEMVRYGNGVAHTMAHASATHLLERDQIELAVTANHAIAQSEIAGVVFYSVNNEIIAISGVNDRYDHYTAPATLEGNITGYVSVVLNEAAFAPPNQIGQWLISIGVLLLTPFITIALMQLTTRRQRSLPIVSVPEARSSEPQQAFCLVVNLHNQIELDAKERKHAVADALIMAREVCAIHQGIAADITERGVVVLFASEVVTPAQAICASFLLQQLLVQFETQGRFRAYLTVITAPDSPADMTALQYTDLADAIDIDDALLLAALARDESVLVSGRLNDQLKVDEQSWTEPFVHPLTADVKDKGALFITNNLPDSHRMLVDNQAELILGFQATG